LAEAYSTLQVRAMRWGIRNRVWHRERDSRYSADYASLIRLGFW